MIEFGVEIDQWKAGEKPPPETTFCDGVGGNHSHCDNKQSPLVVVPSGVKLNSQPSISDNLELNCFPGHASTLMVHLGLFNKTRLRHMAPN